MRLYTEEQRERAATVDLVPFLEARGERFKKSGSEYRWTTHDSVTVRKNVWYQHSNNDNGNSIDFLSTFYGMSYREAVKELLNGEEPAGDEGSPGSCPIPSRKEEKTMETDKNMENLNEMENTKTVGTAERMAKADALTLPSAESEPVKMMPVNEQNKMQEAKALKLPEKNENNDIVRKYLVENRGICGEIVDLMLQSGKVYESKGHHNTVFTGSDADSRIRYASVRGTKEKYRSDVSGSDKAYGFGYVGNSDRLYVFEAPIDLLSFLSARGKGWEEDSYISLGGVSEKSLMQFLLDHKNIGRIYLGLDNDTAGNEASIRLASLIPKGKEIFRLRPALKDFNECLIAGMDIERMAKAELMALSSAEPLVPVTKLSEIQETEVEWLWYPFIPLGKITLVQGNPGKGKTWLAMSICAYCTNRGELPNTVPIDPFNVIYQTAEDGLSDTIKPRLLKCGADPDRVIVINEDEKQLTMKDDRIEAAIRQNHVRLLILDPLQAFIGADVDMNRANETRPIFQKLGQVAERTGCAIVLIGHLNKASGQRSDYRGLGSMDITASVRSVIIVEKVEKETERDVRVVAQIKDSLAMKEDPVAFSLSEEGLTWIGNYKITADELLSGGKGEIKETKLDMAKRLLVEILSKYPRMALDDIYKKLKVHKISERTVRDAKSQLSDRLMEEYVQGHKVLSLKADEKEKPVQEPRNSDTKETFQATA